MRITLFRIVVTIALLWGGIQGLYVALFNLKPSEYSISDYLAAKPDKEWLTISGGALDLIDMSYSESKVGDRVKEVYIPLTLPDSKDTDPVKILVATKDPEALEFATQLKSAKGEAEVLMLFLKAQAKLNKPAITGLVRFGIDLKDEDARKLRELNQNLASDFVILAEGEKPAFGLSIALFLGGLVLLGLMMKGGRNRSEPPPLPSQAAAPALPNAG